LSLDSSSSEVQSSFIAFRAIPFLELSTSSYLRWIQSVKSFPRRSPTSSFLRYLGFLDCSNLRSPLVVWKTSNDLPQHFFVGVGLAKQLQVVGDVGETSEHVFDRFICLHFEQFVLMYVHVHFCFTDLACPLYKWLSVWSKPI